MTQFYAQPYDISATGFYFETADEYAEKAAEARNDKGQKVEEFELQFIDGELIDVELCKAIGINQANIHTVIEKLDEWDDWQKIRITIAAGECGYLFDLGKDGPEDFDIDIYQVESMRELAEQFVDEGMFGDIPENLQFYIDHDAIARDLAMDYTETEINGQRLVYRI